MKLDLVIDTFKKTGKRLEIDVSKPSTYSASHTFLSTGISQGAKMGMSTALSAGLSPTLLLADTLASTVINHMSYTQSGQITYRNHNVLKAALGPYESVNQSQLLKSVDDVKRAEDASHLVGDWMDSLIEIGEGNHKEKLIEAKTLFADIKSQGEKENKELAKAVRRVQQFQRIIDSPGAGVAKSIAQVAMKIPILQAIPTITVAGGAIAATAATAGISMGVSIGVTIAVASTLALTKYGLNYKKDKAEIKNIEVFYELNKQFDTANLKFIEVMAEVEGESKTPNKEYLQYLQLASKYLESAMQLGLSASEHQIAAGVADLSLESTYDVTEDAVSFHKLLNATSEEIYDRISAIEEPIQRLKMAIITNRKNIGLLELTANRTADPELSKNLHADIGFHKSYGQLLNQRINLLETEMDIHNSTLEKVHKIEFPMLHFKSKPMSPISESRSSMEFLSPLSPLSADSLSPVGKVPVSILNRVDEFNILKTQWHRAALSPVSDKNRVASSTNPTSKDSKGSFTVQSISNVDEIMFRTDSNFMLTESPRLESLKSKRNLFSSNGDLKPISPPPLTRKEKEFEKDLQEFKILSKDIRFGAEILINKINTNANTIFNTPASNETRKAALKEMKSALEGLHKASEKAGANIEGYLEKQKSLLETSSKKKVPLGYNQLILKSEEIQQSYLSASKLYREAAIYVQSGNRELFSPSIKSPSLPSKAGMFSTSLSPARSAKLSEFPSSPRPS